MDDTYVNIPILLKYLNERDENEPEIIGMRQVCYFLYFHSSRFPRFPRFLPFAFSTSLDQVLRLIHLSQQIMSPIDEGWERYEFSPPGSSRETELWYPQVSTCEKTLLSSPSCASSNYRAVLGG